MSKDTIMLLKKLSVFVGALLISCITSAQQEMNLKKTDQVFDAFLQCDKQFFKKLAENKISFNHYVDVTTSDNVTYISVESIKNGEENKVTFKKVYPYHGLTVSGYRNLNISTATSGKFYYWGFILDNSVEEVKRTLTDINWQKYNSNIYNANAKIYEIKSHSYSWQDNPYSIDNVIPKIGSAEKSLFLETLPNNQSQLTCSLQGDVDKTLLYSIRPDIKVIVKKMEIEHKESSKKIKQLKELDYKKQPQNEVNINLQKQS